MGNQASAWALQTVPVDIDRSRFEQIHDLACPRTTYPIQSGEFHAVPDDTLPDLTLKQRVSGLTAEISPKGSDLDWRHCGGLLRTESHEFLLASLTIRVAGHTRHVWQELPRSLPWAAHPPAEVVPP